VHSTTRFHQCLHWRLIIVQRVPAGLRNSCQCQPANNLHPLEVAFTAHAEGKKRQKNESWSNFTPSLPSTSTIEEVDNKDMISLGSNVRMTMEDIWDSVNEQLGLDMMDQFIFGTFNEVGVKKQVSFHSSELHT